MTLSLESLASLAACHFARSRNARTWRYFVETYLPAMTLTAKEIR